MSVAPQPGQRYSPQYRLGYGAGQRARRQGEPPLTPWSEQRWPLPAEYDRGFRAGYAAADAPPPIPPADTAESDFADLDMVARATFARGYQAGLAALRAGPSHPVLPAITGNYAESYLAGYAAAWPTAYPVKKRAGHRLALPTATLEHLAAAHRARAEQESLAAIERAAQLCGEGRWSHQARVRLWYGGLP